jgi:hypothetical protein
LRVSKQVAPKLLEYGLVLGESLDRYPDLVQKFIPPAMKYAQELGIELILPPDYLHVLELQSTHEADRTNTPRPAHDDTGGIKIAWNCLDPWITSFIANDGEVNPCCNIRESIENLKGTTFQSIWFGEKLSILRRSILEAHPPKECLSCPRREMTKLAVLKLKLSLSGIARFAAFRVLNSK